MSALSTLSMTRRHCLQSAQNLNDYSQYNSNQYNAGNTASFNGGYTPYEEEEEEAYYEVH